MTTPITLSSIARLAAPVLVAGAPAAGCGTVAANPGGPNKPAADLPVVSASASGSGFRFRFWFRAAGGRARQRRCRPSPAARP